MVALFASSPSQKLHLGPSTTSLLHSMAAGQARSSPHTRGLLFLALAASTFCLWSIYAWYQGIYTELEMIRAERNSAVAAGQSREFGQRALVKENERMRANFREEMALVQAQMEELNMTINTAGKAVGYANFPGGQLPMVNGLSMDDIVVIIKTGATEAYKALPIHLSTTLTHTPNILLFSDHEQTMGQYHIQDALDEVTPDILENNGDWQLYIDQKQYMALGQSPEFLEMKGGWDLDKYKNLHMLSKTYKQRPDAKWYLYIDADSYVLMHNLLLFLSGLDHTKKLYLGSAAFLNNLAFGHGGTGYVISHGAMKHVMEKEPNIARKYDQHAKENCCGDYVLARAFKDEGIELSWINPTFQGDPQYKLEMDKLKHCQPIVTLHHMLPHDVGSVWDFERQIARPDTYILYQDLFEQFVYPHLKDERWDWDCMSGDRGETRELPEDTWEGEATHHFDQELNETVTSQKRLSRQERKKRTFDACKKICREKDDCIMFRTWQQECKIDWHLALGYKVPVSKHDNEEYRSGWMMDRVEEMRKEAPCAQPKADWAHEQVKWS